MKFESKPQRLSALALLALSCACASAIAFAPVAAQSRTVRVVNATAPAGGTARVALELIAQGNENAAGFSLTFNPALLSNPQATLGSGATGASLNANALQAAQGRLGLALAMSPGQVFAAGTRQLVVVSFAVAGSAAPGATPIGFGDQPVARDVADLNAGSLAVVFTSGAITITGAVASVSAASFGGAELASESIVAAFGAGLATTTQIVTTVPLPTELAGTSVKVRDSAGMERPAPLFFVAPAQVNYLIPTGTAAGAATVTMTSGNGAVSTGVVQIATVAPGLFSANASGQGVAAGVALRVKADGAQVFEPIARFDQSQNRLVAIPIDLGPEGEQVFLILYGTGFRFNSALPAVTCGIGGVNAEALYAGVAPGFVGLDQTNVRLPRSLAGRGEVDVVLAVDGKAANMVRISVK